MNTCNVNTCNVNRLCNDVDVIMLYSEDDDDLLRDAKYQELFSETYLQPIVGHKVLAIQPGRLSL